LHNALHLSVGPSNISFQNRSLLDSYPAGDGIS